VSKQRLHKSHRERFNLKKLNKVEYKGQYCAEVSSRFAALEDLDTEVDINRTWKTIRDDFNIPAKKESRLL
jgi:hypothetical protein